LKKRCLICGKASAVENKLSDICIYRCNHCGHCFTDNEAFEDMENYSENYYKIDHKNWFDNPNIKLFKGISDIIYSNIHNESLIEIGCGKGDFLRFIRSKNCKMDLTGIDITKNENIDGIQFIQDNALSFKYKMQYDIVITLAVIEHISDPHAYMNLLKNICTKNGLIIIMTINDRSILYHLARLLRKISINRPYKRLYEKHHINHFNHSSLKKLIELHGLMYYRIINHNIPFSAIDTGVIPESLNFIASLGVMITFLLGRITRKTYLQTVICKKINQ
jgi:SAM-dependent methyltransferase